MGTKLLESASSVNLLLASPNSKKLLSTTNEWGACCLKAQPVFKDNNYQQTAATTDFPNLHSCYSTTTMVDDRMVNDDLVRSLESIRKTMLEHDHLFKQQVKELHRLYGVQVMLMKDLKSKVTQQPDQTRVANVNKVNQGCFDLQQCVAEPKTGGHVFDENEEEPEIELTLGLGNRIYSRKEMKENYQEQTHCSVDLLLFPNSNRDQFQVIEQQNWLSDRKEQSPSARKRPHWLLQSLGSHKTN